MIPVALHDVFADRRWQCVSVTEQAGAGMRVQLSERGGTGQIAIDVFPRATPLAKVARLGHIAIRYTFAGIATTEQKNSASDFIREFAFRLDDWLGSSTVDLTALVGLEVTSIGATTPRPTPRNRVALPLAAPQTDRRPDLNLDGSGSLQVELNAECGQRCGFCGIHATFTPYDGGDVWFDPWMEALRAHRRAGGVAFTLKGVDPLAYSRVIDLVRGATEMGYLRAQVFSPCTRLADPEFYSLLLEALPAESHFLVPIYATDAETHDRVVGRPGAHALVMRAIQRLRESSARVRLDLLSVATTDNVAALPALARWAASQGLSLSVRMPYPVSDAVSDPFPRVVPRMTDVAESLGRLLHDAPRRLWLFGVPPCLIERVQRSQGVDRQHWIDAFGPGTVVPGRENRDVAENDPPSNRRWVAPAVPCPEAPSCELAGVCPREILEGYVRLYGLSEFRAVGPSTTSP